MVQKANIGIICTSDHASISIDLSLQDRLSTQYQWKLNESLLAHESARTEIEKEIEFYLQLTEVSRILSGNLISLI